jgi:CRISPR-associated protein Cas1
MQTLFIDRKNAELEIDRGRLLVRIEGQRPVFSVPTQIVEMLVISAPVRFSSTLMTQLTQENIVTVFINPRKSEASTISTGMMHNDAKRRLWQYQVLSDEALRLQFAKQLMEHKVRLQKALLTRALQKRPDCRHPLFTGIGRIAAIQQNIPAAVSVDSLRGLEGAAGAAYFEAYHSLFAPSLQFNKRNRRPPRDPVNVILSLSFTLLHAEAVRVLFSVGFDPLLGIYHEPDFGRESLACDLVELFRPLAERWIWRLFADETMRAEYFTLDQGNTEKPCLLGKRGREVFYQAYDKQARRWRKLMRRSARHWLTLLRQHMGE